MMTSMRMSMAVSVVDKAVEDREVLGPAALLGAPLVGCPPWAAALRGGVLDLADRVEWAVAVD